MYFHWAVGGLLLWRFLVCSPVIAQPAEAPPAVRAFVQHADPGASVEYCGAVSSSKFDYYLFLLQRKELAGIVLVRQRPGTLPVIADADTSLFPFRADSARSVEIPVQHGIEILLRKRNLAKKSRTPQRASSPDPDVSAVGREIDRVIYPLSGFRLGSNSTREILRVLRMGPTVAVDPRTAPPGSIIVSPTQSSIYGPIYLGHAGIVGSDGLIYSADARYGGARTKNYSVAGWSKQFSGTNGSYAFILHAPSDKDGQRFQSQITWLNIDPSSSESCGISGS
ncbi:MAG: hypothetical protein JO066_04215 [Verrucomicrobia bacterium]|nr:hypothetical protein [Verrucomicrobiota bacterium]